MYVKPEIFKYYKLADFFSFLKCTSLQMLCSVALWNCLYEYCYNNNNNNTDNHNDNNNNNSNWNKQLVGKLTWNQDFSIQNQFDGFETELFSDPTNTHSWYVVCPCIKVCVPLLEYLSISCWTWTSNLVSIWVFVLLSCAQIEESSTNNDYIKRMEY